MSDAVLSGQVTHARLTAPSHRFRYGLGLLRLDLDRLSQTAKKFRLLSVNRANVVSIRRKDYLRGGNGDLATAARDLVENRLGVRPEGRVELFTQPRCLGSGFNPLNLYRCHDRQEKLLAVIVEVNNTPWGEQVAYVLSPGECHADSLDLEFEKQMHVSPFQPMNMRYQLLWLRNAHQERITLRCWQKNRSVFVATMRLRVKPFTAQALYPMALRNGVVPGRVLLAIHWQALRLWFKRARYFPYPAPAVTPQRPLSPQ